MDLAINNVTNLCNFVGKIVCVCVWVYLELLSHFLSIKINLTNISSILIKIADLSIWHGQLVLPLGQVENSSTCPTGQVGKKVIAIPWIHREGWKVCQFVWCFLSKSLHHIHRPKVSSNQHHSVSNKSLRVQYVLQLSPWSSDTRSLLSSLFFLKRLQAMQEFFHMVTQLAAALQGNIVYLSWYSLSSPLCMTSYIALVFTWSLPSPLYDLIYCTWLYMASPLLSVWPHILHLSLHDLSSPLPSVWPHILHLALHDLYTPLPLSVTPRVLLHSHPAGCGTAG